MAVTATVLRVILHLVGLHELFVLFLDLVATILVILLILGDDLLVQDLIWRLVYIGCRVVTDDFYPFTPLIALFHGLLSVLKIAVAWHFISI